MRRTPNPHRPLTFSSVTSLGMTLALACPAPSLAGDLAPLSILVPAAPFAFIVFLMAVHLRRRTRVVPVIPDDLPDTLLAAQDALNQRILERGREARRIQSLVRLQENRIDALETLVRRLAAKQDELSWSTILEPRPEPDSSPRPLDQDIAALRDQGLTEFEIAKKLSLNETEVHLRLLCLAAHVTARSAT